MLMHRWLRAASLALLLSGALAARAADPQSADYRAGYEAGYKAALEALKAGQASPAAPAAQPAAAARPGESAAARAPAGPPDWWNHSALLYDRLDPAWRHHVELQFSGTNVNGNDNGFAVRGGGKVFSRSNRWTNELIANVDKRRIAQAGGALNQRDYRMLEESVRYDLTRKLYASGGFILERDDVNFIDRRTTLLGGLGAYLLDDRKVRVNVFGGLGQLRERYMQPVPALIGLDGRSSGLLYLYETVDWQLAENWSLQQGFRHLRDLRESGEYVPDPRRPGLYVAGRMVRRYRNIASLGLSYQLSPRSSVSVVVESRYDSNPWPDVRPHDITRRLMLNLQY